MDGDKRLINLHVDKPCVFRTRLQRGRRGMDDDNPYRVFKRVQAKESENWSEICEKKYALNATQSGALARAQNCGKLGMCARGAGKKRKKEKSPKRLIQKDNLNI